MQLGAGGVGLGGALAGLDPEHLEVGEGGAELFLGERVALLELAQDGHDLVAQPALLAVRAQQQADVGRLGRWDRSIIAKHPCSWADPRGVGSALGFGLGRSML